MARPRRGYYTRFEFFIPVVFTLDGQRHELSPLLIEQFINATTHRFGGVTQTNPELVPFKGFWLPEQGRALSIDYLMSIFGLIPIDQTDTAAKFFQRWKERMERETAQDIILVTFYQVQVLGGFI